MAFLFKLSEFLKRLFLRGLLLQWWISRKATKLDTRFIGNLLKEARHPEIPKATHFSIRRRKVDSIILICDNMWEQESLLPELRKICPVHFVNLHPALKGHPQPAWATLTAACVNNFVRDSENIDPGLILFYARPALLSGEVFDTLRARWSCPLLGMNLDDKVEFLDYQLFPKQPGNYQAWAKYFDMNLTNTLVTADWYTYRNLPVYYMPPGFHSRPDLSLPRSAQFEHPLSFVGSRKPEREVFLEKLRNVGVDVKLFGSGWPNCQRVEQPEVVFRGSMMNLGIGLASPSETLTTTKGRDFECPGTGACYLTTYNWELCAHFELGKEILCYRNLEELVEIYAFHRRRPEICLKIAQAAYIRCQNEHTWEKRFRKLFRELGLAKNEA